MALAAGGAVVEVMARGSEVAVRSAVAWLVEMMAADVTAGVAKQVAVKATAATEAEAMAMVPMAAAIAEEVAVMGVSVAMEMAAEATAAA